MVAAAEFASQFVPDVRGPSIMTRAWRALIAAISRQLGATGV